MWGWKGKKEVSFVCEKIDTYFIVLISWVENWGKAYLRFILVAFGKGITMRKNILHSMPLPSPILKYTHDKTGT